MTWLFIESSDVWLFRDGKPFSRGEGHQAYSVFPPSPMTMQGALRSHILAHHAIEWSVFQQQSTPAARELGKMIGTTTSLGQFSLRGPFLARQEMDREQIVRYVPLPADAVCDESNNDNEDKTTAYALQPARGMGIAFQANWPQGETLAPLWISDKTPEAPPSSCWISDEALENYFSEGFTGFLRSEVFFHREARFGIAMNYEKGRPEDQMIYQAEFVRPVKEHGLLVQIDDAIPWSDIVGQKGVLGLGERFPYIESL